MGRFGRPEEIAATALLLAGPDGGFYVGATLSPNGGDVMYDPATARNGQVAQLSLTPVHQHFFSRGGRLWPGGGVAVKLDVVH